MRGEASCPPARPGQTANPVGMFPSSCRGPLPFSRAESGSSQQFLLRQSELRGRAADTLLFVIRAQSGTWVLPRSCCFPLVPLFLGQSPCPGQSDPVSYVLSLGNQGWIGTGRVHTSGLLAALGLEFPSAQLQSVASLRSPCGTNTLRSKGENNNVLSLLFFFLFLQNRGDISSPFLLQDKLQTDSCLSKLLQFASVSQPFLKLLSSCSARCSHLKLPVSFEF